MINSKKIKNLILYLYFCIYIFANCISCILFFQSNEKLFLSHELFHCFPLNKLEKYEEVLLNEFLLSLL